MCSAEKKTSIQYTYGPKTKCKQIGRRVTLLLHYIIYIMRISIITDYLYFSSYSLRHRKDCEILLTRSGAAIGSVGYAVHWDPRYWVGGWFRSHRI